MSKIQEQYKPFKEWKWVDYSGTKTLNIEQFISDNKDRYFFIGTDSQNYSKKRQTIFTTALISYKIRSGGLVALHKDKIPMVEHLRQRLLMEAMRSLEVAWFLDQKVDKKNIIGIHLDVNESLKFKSGKYKEELIGLIAAQGFNCIIKPDAWAASKVADSRC